MQYNVNAEAPVSYTMLHAIIDSMNDVSARVEKLESGEGENATRERMFADLGREALWEATVCDSLFPEVVATRQADGCLTFEPKMAVWCECGIIVSEVARHMSMPEFMEVYGDRLAAMYADAQNEAVAKIETTEAEAAATTAEVA